MKATNHTGRVAYDGQRCHRRNEETIRFLYEPRRHVGRQIANSVMCRVVLGGRSYYHNNNWQI